MMKLNYKNLFAVLWMLILNIIFVYIAVKNGLHFLEGLFFGSVAGTITTVRIFK